MTRHAMPEPRNAAVVETALGHTEIKDEGVVQMAASGMTDHEIAERVAAQSGLDVQESHVSDWLEEYGRCRNTPDGMSDCRRPSDPTSAAGWCRTCQRSA